jgi:hypothetical protein
MRSPTWSNGLRGTREPAVLEAFDVRREGLLQGQRPSGPAEGVAFQPERLQPSRLAQGVLICQGREDVICRTTWKGYSRNFAQTEF